MVDQKANKRPPIIYIASLILVLSYIGGFPLAKAQNPKLVDSLVHVYNYSHLHDSSKLKILYDISFDHPNQDERIFYANKLIKLAEKNHNQLFKFRGLFQKGNALRTKGDLDEAANCFFRCISIATELDFKEGIGAAYLALADVYSINKNFRNSSAYYQKSISIFKSLGDSVNLATALMNAGDDYYLADQLDSALLNFHQSLKIYQALNYELGIGYNLGNMGLVYAKQGKFELAEEHFNRSTQILKRLEAYYPLTVYYLSISEIFESKQNYSKALQFANLSLELAMKDGLKEQIQDANLRLSHLYAQKQDYEKAYQYHTQYVAYRDSINKEDEIRRIADLRTAYEVSQKQAEIDLLTTQRQINYMIGLGLIFITLLLGALAFVLYRNNKIKQTTNLILSSQKEELENQHHKLEALNNTKDRFFSIISHDLRGPVNAFNGISELIKHYIAKNEMGQLKEVSEYIDKSARQLSTLLDNLLDWSIRQQGTFPFNPERIHLNPLLEEIVEMFGITAHSKKIILSVNLEEEIYIWADRNSLLTIIRNLVNNALKFTEPDGLVTLSAYSQKSFALINIIDTGIGIPEEKLESLFVLKEKTVSRGTSGEKGLGIGLNLAYEFAQMNNGTIIVNSEEKAGTIITVKIPVTNSSSEKRNLNESKKTNQILHPADHLRQ